MTEKDEQRSLTPAVFHILLALADGELHGYGIMKRVREDSGDRVKMGAGTLYGSLKRMLEAGLVEECGPRVDAALGDERRIYYRITGVGERALAGELARYDRLVARARDLNLLPKNFRYEG